MEKDTSEKIDDPAQIFKLQNHQERERYTMVWHSICGRIWERPTDLRNCPINIAIWSQFASDCLWALFWPSKDHEEFRRVAMNKSSAQHTSFNGVRAATSTEADRSQSCMHYAGIAGLENPAAKLIKMKVHVFLRFEIVCRSLECRSFQ